MIHIRYPAPFRKGSISACTGVEKGLTITGWCVKVSTPVNANIDGYIKDDRNPNASHYI